jgi:hypothetical protein
MALAGLAVSLIAVLISAVAFQVNWRAAQAAERHGRMPVLIAAYEVGAVGVLNIGNGPALNVVISQGTGKVAEIDVLGADLAAFQRDGTWVNHRHLTQIPAGAEHWYAWKWDEAAVGLTYTDALGHHYTAVNSQFGTKVVDGLDMTHPPLVELDYAQKIVGRPTRK